MPEINGQNWEPDVYDAMNQHKECGGNFQRSVDEIYRQSLEAAQSPLEAFDVFTNAVNNIQQGRGR